MNKIRIKYYNSFTKEFTETIVMQYSLTEAIQSTRAAQDYKILVLSAEYIDFDSVIASLQQ